MGSVLDFLRMVSCPSCRRVAEQALGIHYASLDPDVRRVCRGGVLVERVGSVAQAQDNCLKSRADPLGVFDAFRRSACHGWHPCRDAGGYFHFEPVVPLRSPPATCWDASGIRMRGAGRHAPFTGRSSRSAPLPFRAGESDGVRQPLKSATGGCRFRRTISRASDGRSVRQYLPRSEPRTLWALAPFSEIYVDLSRRCVGWIRAVLSKNRLGGIFCPMDVDTFRDGFQ